jgi:hypothetical protein
MNGTTDDGLHHISIVSCRYDLPMRLFEQREQREEASPVAIVILNAVKNRLACYFAWGQAGCLSANREATRLILHYVQNDNGKWVAAR